MPDGKTFNGAAEFRKILLADHKDQFIRTLCSRLLGYALGRGLEIHDQPTLLRRRRKHLAPSSQNHSVAVRRHTRVR